MSRPGAKGASVAAAEQAGRRELWGKLLFCPPELRFLGICGANPVDLSEC